MVTSLVGPSLDDLRKKLMKHDYSLKDALNIGTQVLKGLENLHGIGYIHRDIKPGNLAIGLGNSSSTIFLLDFGLAHRIFEHDTTEMSQPREKVHFVGNVYFASLAAHHGQEQGRKDDIEMCLYLIIDLIDNRNSLPWYKVHWTIYGFSKEKFVVHEEPYRIKNKKVPRDFEGITDYLNGLTYYIPDYNKVKETLQHIAKTRGIDMTGEPDWLNYLKEGEKTTNKSNDKSKVDDIHKKHTEIFGKLRVHCVILNDGRRKQQEESQNEVSKEGVDRMKRNKRGRH